MDWLDDDDHDNNPPLKNKHVPIIKKHAKKNTPPIKNEPIKESNKLRKNKKQIVNPTESLFNTQNIERKTKDDIDFTKRSKESNIKITHEKKMVDSLNEFKNFCDVDGYDSDDATKKKKSTKKVFKELTRQKLKTIKQKQDSNDRMKNAKEINDQLYSLSTDSSTINQYTEDDIASVNTNVWNGKYFDNDKNNDLIESDIVDETTKNDIDMINEDEIIEKYTGIENDKKNNNNTNREKLGNMMSSDKKKPIKDQKLFYHTGEDIVEEVGGLLYEMNKNTDNDLNNNNINEQFDNTDNNDSNVFISESTDNIQSNEINNNRKSKDDYNILNSKTTLHNNNKDRMQKSVGLQKLITSPNQKTNSNRNQIFKISGLPDTEIEHIFDFESYSRDTNHFISDQQAIMRRMYARTQINNTNNHREFDLKMISRVEGLTRAEEEEYLRIPRAGENPCMKDNECEGMKFEINAQPVVLVEFLDYKEREERKKNKNKTYPRRPCVMCRRSMILYFYMSIKSPCAPIDTSICIASYYNFTDKAGEYCSSQCIAGNGSYWQGLPGPIVAHNRRYYEQIIVDKEYRFLQTGYKRPEKEGVGTKTLHFFQ